jgi:hypothetical protein
LHQLEAEHATVEGEGTLDVRHFQVDMANSDAWIGAHQVDRALRRAMFSSPGFAGKFCHRATERSIHLIFLPLVVEQNVDEQKNSGAGGEKEEQDRQAGITPDPERRFHPHQHGRAYD